ncbi:MAG: hypothetical protein ACKO7W_00975, partial [Elainella sp.]
GRLVQFGFRSDRTNPTSPEPYSGSALRRRWWMRAEFLCRCFTFYGNVTNLAFPPEKILLCLNSASLEGNWVLVVDHLNYGPLGYYPLAIGRHEMFEISASSRLGCSSQARKKNLSQKPEKKP